MQGVCPSIGYPHAQSQPEKTVLMYINHYADGSSSQQEKEEEEAAVD